METLGNRSQGWAYDVLKNFDRIGKKIETFSSEILKCFQLIFLLWTFCRLSALYTSGINCTYKAKDFSPSNCTFK